MVHAADRLSRGPVRVPALSRRSRRGASHHSTGRLQAPVLAGRSVQGEHRARCSLVVAPPAPEATRRPAPRPERGTHTSTPLRRTREPACPPAPQSRRRTAQQPPQAVGMTPCRPHKAVLREHADKQPGPFWHTRALRWPTGGRRRAPRQARPASGSGGRSGRSPLARAPGGRRPLTAPPGPGLRPAGPAQHGCRHSLHRAGGGRGGRAVLPARLALPAQTPVPVLWAPSRLLSAQADDAPRAVASGRPPAAPGTPARPAADSWLAGSARAAGTKRLRRSGPCWTPGRLSSIPGRGPGRPGFARCRVRPAAARQASWAEAASPDEVPRGSRATPVCACAAADRVRSSRGEGGTPPARLADDLIVAALCRQDYRRGCGLAINHGARAPGEPGGLSRAGLPGSPRWRAGRGGCQVAEDLPHASSPSPGLRGPEASPRPRETVEAPTARPRQSSGGSRGSWPGPETGPAPCSPEENGLARLPGCTTASQKGPARETQRQRAGSRGAHRPAPPGQARAPGARRPAQPRPQRASVRAGRARPHGQLQVAQVCRVVRRGAICAGLVPDLSEDGHREQKMGRHRGGKKPALCPAPHVHRSEWPPRETAGAAEEAR